MYEFQFYQNKAAEMIGRDKKRDELFRGIEAMWQTRWDLPSGLSSVGWIHKVVSSDPHDALRAGTRVLSSTAPRINVQIAGWGEEKSGAVENIERVLLWLFKQANRRNQSEILRDLVLSALMYDEVAAQVVYLPNQLENFASPEPGRTNFDHAMQYGPFAILLRNPKQVHINYSDWMPESVVYTYLSSEADLIQQFGSTIIPKLSQLESGKGKHTGRYMVHDYTDREYRVIWCTDQNNVEDSGAICEIFRGPHGLPFLPWVVKSGGSGLADNAEDQRLPLLSSIYKTGQWETLNLVETLLTSEIIAYSAAPRMAVEGPTDGVAIDYGDPGRMAHVPPGHRISALEPPIMDENLRQIADRMIAGINKSTVPKVLQSGEFPAGIAYATLNLATQSGVKALLPYKELAEFAMAEIFSLMINWACECGAVLKGLGMAKGDKGRSFEIDCNDINPADVYINVELTADVPFDRLSRVNAAAIAVRELGYSRERALEQIGEPDPAGILKQAEREVLSRRKAEKEE